MFFICVLKCRLLRPQPHAHLKQIPSPLRSHTVAMASPRNQCVICMQDLNNGQEVGAQLCGRVFHSECWKDWEDVKLDDFDIVVRDDVPCPICKMSAVMCQRTFAGTFDAAGGSGGLLSPVSAAWLPLLIFAPLATAVSYPIWE